MKTWTIDEMLAERPRPDYTRERIAELWAGRDTLTVLDFLDLDIPDADKVWAALRPGAVPRGVLLAWLDVVVARAIRRVLGRSGVPAWETWAEQWLDGSNNRVAAKAAAAAAWVVAAEAEAASATEAAVWAARAEAAAEAALAASAARARVAERPAEVAAKAAVWVAAEAAEHMEQVADLRRLLGEGRS